MISSSGCLSARSYAQIPKSIYNYLRLESRDTQRTAGYQASGVKGREWLETGRVHRSSRTEALRAP